MVNRKIMVIALVTIVVITACTPTTNNNIAVPSSNFSIEEVININLKVLDLTKINKQLLGDFYSLSLDKYKAIGYMLEYRFPDKPIKIYIVKSESSTLTELFWKDSIESLFSKNSAINNNVTQPNTAYYIANDEENSFYTWYKDNWFLAIAVPITVKDCELIRDKVKDIIMNHFYTLNLNK